MQIWINAHHNQNYLGSRKDRKEENAALSLSEYEVLKPSDFLHRDVINYTVVTVAKGLMFLGERVISHVFPITVEQKLSVKVSIANVVKDITDKLLLEDLLARKRNGVLDINNGDLLKLPQDYSIQNIKDWQ